MLRKSDYPQYVCAVVCKILIMVTDNIRIKVFISYARENLNIAKRLYNDLKENNYEPWLDEYNLSLGLEWKTAIRKAIGNSVFLSACYRNDRFRSGDSFRRNK